MKEIYCMCQYCTLSHTIKLLLLDTSINVAARLGKTSSGTTARLFKEHTVALKSIGHWLACPLQPKGLSPHPKPRPDSC